MAENWKDGSRSGKRPTGSNRFDPSRMRAWPGAGDVIVQEHDSG
jgi:hypothetical protein